MMTITKLRTDAIASVDTILPGTIYSVNDRLYVKITHGGYYVVRGNKMINSMRMDSGRGIFIPVDKIVKIIGISGNALHIASNIKYLKPKIAKAIYMTFEKGETR